VNALAEYRLGEEAFYTRHRLQLRADNKHLGDLIRKLTEWEPKHRGTAAEVRGKSGDFLGLSAFLIEYP
jgi:hypothetical protein